MKRKLVILCFFATLVLFGCISSVPSITPEERHAQLFAEYSAKAEIYDVSVPAEEQSILHIPGGYFNVYEFDGKAVKWFKLTIKGETNIKIPSGEHTFKVKVMDGESILSIVDMEDITFTFEPGIAYALDMLTTGVAGSLVRYHLIKVVNIQKVQYSKNPYTYHQYEWGIAAADKTVNR
ncbi:hypothetical protein AGMMS50230_03280 [Spirochaetia bacterium]|nr:hypothetical protein AGMMS50230_03280 [Spirochaetia bacterium]